MNDTGANSVSDLAAKVRDDPLLMIKRKEEEKRKELMNNPVKMKQLRLMLQEKLDKSSKRDKKKKKRKEKKKKSKSKRKSDSDSRSSDDENISSRNGEREAHDGRHAEVHSRYGWQEGTYSFPIIHQSIPVI